MAKNRRRQLRDLYDQVPSIDCKGLCADSCGPIDMSTTERQIIRDRGVEITDRMAAVVQLANSGHYDCDALVDGKCSVYSDRPMICRVWGVVESLPCDFGCTPERVLPDREGLGLIAESLEIGGSDSAPLSREQVGKAYDENRSIIQPMMRRHWRSRP